MYNSRPRRIGYDSFSESFAVPENYSGNAFRGTISEVGEGTMDSEVVSPASENDVERAEEVFKDLGEQGCEKKSEAEPHTHKNSLTSRLGFNAGKLLGGSFGVEELLLIALILLISQSENNEDIIALLVLLLFIG